MEEKVNEQNQIILEGSQFKMNWDPAEGVFFIDIWGVLKKEDSQDFKDKFHEGYTGVISRYGLQGSFKIFVDASGIKSVDHEARRIFTETITRYTQKTIAAVYNPSTFVKVVTGFLMAIGRSHVDAKFFTSREEGLKWLKSEK